MSLGSQISSMSKIGGGRETKDVLLSLKPYRLRGLELRRGRSAGAEKEDTRSKYKYVWKRTGGVAIAT